MLLKALTKYQPSNLVIYLIFGIILWSKVIFNSKIPGIYSDSDPMPVYTAIFDLIGSPGLFIVCKLLALVLVLLLGLIFNGILNQYNLLGNRSYLPGIIFLIITANLPEYQILHPVYFATLLLIYSWNVLINGDFGGNTMAAYFNSALLLGLSTLFYPNYSYLIIIIYASTSLNRVGNIREFIMISLGILTVWYFYLSLFFIFTNKFNFSGINNDIAFTVSDFSSLKPGQIIFFYYFALIVLLASFQSTRSIALKKIQIRRNLKILFIWFLIGCAIFIFTNSGFELVYLVAIPLSALVTIFFENTELKWVKEIAFILLLLVTLMNQFFPNLIV